MKVVIHAMKRNKARWADRSDWSGGTSSDGGGLPRGDSQAVSQGRDHHIYGSRSYGTFDI